MRAPSAMLRAALAGLALAATAAAQAPTVVAAPGAPSVASAQVAPAAGAAAAPQHPAAAPLAQAAPAAAAAQSATAAPATGAASAFTLNAGHLEFHARALAVADVFAELRRLVHRNIVVAPDVSAAFTGDLYDMTVEDVVAAICRASGLVAHDEGTYLYIDKDTAETRVFRLGHTRAKDVVDLVRPLLSPIGQVSATPDSKQGIVSSQDEAGGDDYASGDMLIVRDTHAALEVIAQVITSIDESPAQVQIEATILSVSLDEDMQLGVEFTALAGVDFEGAGATSPDGTSVTLGGLDGTQLANGAGGANTVLNSAFKSGGLSVGYLKNGLGVFLKALQSRSDTTVLANPRIVTINKQRGEVLLGRRDGFITSTTTQTSTTQKVEYLETGTRLVFRPYILSGGLVRLEIHPEDSTGGLNAQGLPFKETAEVTTNVMVPDGQTIVIGGLFRERRGDTTNKVPLMGDLPLIGGLFRSEQKAGKREEIVIVLTPHIVNGGSGVAVAPPDSLKGTVGGDGASAADIGRVALPSQDRLLQAALGTAHSLMDGGDIASAWALLGVLGPESRSRPEVLALQAELRSASLPAADLHDVDRRILDGTVSAANAAGAAATGGAASAAGAGAGSAGGAAGATAGG